MLWPFLCSMNWSDIWLFFSWYWRNCKPLLFELSFRNLALLSNTFAYLQHIYQQTCSNINTIEYLQYTYGHTLKHNRLSTTYILSNTIENLQHIYSQTTSNIYTIEYLQYTHFQTRSNIYNVYTLKMIEYIQNVYPETPSNIYIIYTFKHDLTSTIFILSNMSNI